MRSSLILACCGGFVLVGGVLGACGEDAKGNPSDGGAGGSSGSLSGGGGASEGGGPVGGGGGSGGEGAGGTPADVDACVRISACEADGGDPVGMQICLGYQLDVAWEWATVGPAKLGLEALRCKFAAEDCKGVRACTPSVELYAPACADVPGTGFCKDDTWVFCNDLGKPVAAMDCSAEGLSCFSDFVAGCGAEPCDYATDMAKCDEEDPDVLVECSPAGFWTKVHCPTAYNMVLIHGTEGEERITIAGETCGYDEMRGANGCVGTGKECGFFSQECNGSVLETCAGGRLARRDCASLPGPGGLGCGFLTSGQFAGGASCGILGGDCSMGDDERCVDGILHFCDFGEKAEVDCKALGYSGCATGKQAKRNVAYCTP